MNAKVNPIGVPLLKAKDPIIFAAYVAACIVLMDLAAVNIALPEISKHFGISINEVSWVLLASMLTSSSFALVAGRLIEIKSPRFFFVFALLLFALSSFACYLSNSFVVLIAIRFVMGFFESIIYVIGPALIRQYLHRKNQQVSFGIWMMFTGIGISLGPLIGGFLIFNFGWNFVFLINVPLSFFAILLVLKSRIKPAPIKTKVRFDFPGALLSFVFLGGLIYSLNTLNDYGWSELTVYLGLGLSLVCLLVFLRRERRIDFPVFDLKLFRIRNFFLANMGFYLYFLVNIGIRFLRPFYFEEGHGFDTRTSGLLMMVSPLVMVLISPLSRTFSHVVQPKILSAFGVLFLAISTLMFSFWQADTSLAFLIVSMIVLGFGMGLYYPSMAFIGMQSLPEGKSGMGSAAISTSKSIGKLSGVLLFGLLFSLFLNDQQQESDQFISAFQLTFLVGAAIAFLSFLLSLLSQNKNKQSKV
jgi:EmrB/QacA subfamily drug resistance transporter